MSTTTRIGEGFTISLPPEARANLREGEQVSVTVLGEKVVISPEPIDVPTFRDLEERLLTSPDADPLSHEEIEEIIHEARRADR